MKTAGLDSQAVSPCQVHSTQSFLRGLIHHLCKLPLACVTAFNDLSRVNRRNRGRAAAVELLEVRQYLTAYFVDALNGDDANTGTSADAAWETYDPIVSAYGQSNPNVGKVTLQAGDSVHFAPGVYSSTHQNPSEAPFHGFALRGISGTEGSPITISADPGAVFDAQPPGNVDGVTMDLENVSHVVVEGLTFTGFGTELIFPAAAT